MSTTDPDPPQELSTAGLVECRVKSLSELKPGDIVKRDNTMIAYGVDTGVEKFRTGPAVIASRRVLITENDINAWKVYRPKEATA